jgi:plastocyanin
LAVLVLCVSCSNDDNGNATSSAGANRSAATMADVALVTVDMYDNYYGDSDTNLASPPVWSVQSGADVVATLTNHGRRNHNWAIVKRGMQVPVPYEEGQAGDLILHGIGMVYGNSQTTVTFTAPEPGEYMIICTVSGHYPAMQGRLLVTTSQ